MNQGGLLLAVYNSLKQIEREPATLVWDAVRFAEAKHAGQRRVGGEHYICHIYRVLIAGVEEYLEDRSLGLFFLMAIALHDVVEDCGVELEEIRSRFGAEVARLVFHLSHDYEDEPEADYVSRVQAGGRKAIRIKRLDKLDNLRSLNQADKNFRQQKLAELPSFLALWKDVDLEGAGIMEEFLK